MTSGSSHFVHCHFSWFSNHKVCITPLHTHTSNSIYKGKKTEQIHQGCAKFPVWKWSMDTEKKQIPITVYIRRYNVISGNPNPNPGSSTTTYPTVHCSSHQLKNGDPLGCIRCTAKVMLASGSSQGGLGCLKTKIRTSASYIHTGWIRTFRNNSTCTNQVSIKTASFWNP